MAVPIGAISGLSPASKAINVQSITPPAQAPSVDRQFDDVVAQSVGALRNLQQNADSAALDYVSNGKTELHDVMIAMEKAEIGFQLTLQLRNKVVEAYQEIMRMQV